MRGCGEPCESREIPLPYTDEYSIMSIRKVQNSLGLGSNASFVIPLHRMNISYREVRNGVVELGLVLRKFTIATSPFK